MSRKKSLIKIPSSSQIPKDFFRQPSPMKKSYPAYSSNKNLLDFTFMPSKSISMQNSCQVKKTIDLMKKPATATVTRVGRLTL